MSSTKSKIPPKRKPTKRELRQQAVQNRYEKLNRAELEFFWLATKPILSIIWERTDKTETETLEYLLDKFAGLNSFEEILETFDLATEGLGKRNESLTIIEQILDTIENGGKIPEPAKPQPTGNEHLDTLIAVIEPVDWTQYRTDDKPPNERDYILRTVDRIKEAATATGLPIVNHYGIAHQFIETHYVELADSDLTALVRTAAIACGVSEDTARYQFFVRKLKDQFLLDMPKSPQQPTKIFVNLRNGTLFIDKDGEHFEKHDPAHFVRYCLAFDYDTAADCPKWKQHLERSLSPVKSDYAAECLASPFYAGKLERCPIFYGKPKTGKSVMLDVYNAIIGKENIVSETLKSLTQDDYHGDYARARLDGKLVNVCKDVSKKIGDTGIAKTIMSRESIKARRPNKEGFDLPDQGYARLLYAMNDLPSEFFTDSALTRRVAVIGFTNVISQKDDNKDFAQEIIDTERAGVLNWIISGLKRLLEKRSLDPPQECLDEMKRYSVESDPLSGWLDEKEYSPGSTNWILLADAFESFEEYCSKNGNQKPSCNTFRKRLEALGYSADWSNHHSGKRLYFSPVPLSENSYPLCPPLFPSYKTKDESGDNHGDNRGNRDNRIIPESDDCPLTVPSETLENTVSGIMGTKGTEKTGKSFELSELDNLAGVVRDRLAKNEPVKESDILDLFEGDRVPFSNFLTRYGLTVDWTTGTIIDTPPASSKGDLPGQGYLFDGGKP